MPAQYALVPSPDAVVTFGPSATAQAFECQVTSAAVTVTENQITIPATGCAGPRNKAGAPTYTLDLAFLQDWGQVDSLSQYLWDNRRLEVEFSIALGLDPIPVATGIVELAAGPYGGDFAGALTAGPLSMSIIGEPLIGPGVVGLAANGALSGPESGASDPSAMATA